MALTLVAVGSLTSLAIARMPSLSLLPYALLVVLLLHEAERPSRRLWLAVPLLGLWGNLHGGVLVGYALLAVHLVLSRGPVRRRLAIAGAAAGVVLLATSAGWRTVIYYRGAVSNEAARQHFGVWASPSPHNPFDVLMVLATAALIVMWLRGDPRRWEVVAVGGMSVATLMATRNSIWLVLLLLPLAGRGLARAESEAPQALPWKPMAVAMVMLIAGAGWQLTSRGSALDSPGLAAVPTVRQLAAGRSVLAIDPYEETFAQAGIRIWAGNPIDAFSSQTQREYLAFTNDGTIPPAASIGLVVVGKRLAERIKAAGWREVGSVADLLLFAAPVATSAEGTGG